MRDGDLFASTFARGLAVIRSFDRGRERQTLADIARQTDMSRAAARRLVHTLLALGYVRQDGRYFSLTARVLDLGYSYLASTSLWSLAEPHMQAVVAKTGASCSISVLDGDDIVYVARVSPRQLMQRLVSIGSRVPAWVIAMGRVQLAELDDITLRARLADMEITAFTRHTITNRGLLFDRIRADGLQGWSVTDRELDEGISGIAMPIRDRDGAVIAGINLSLKPDQAAEPDRLENLRQDLTGTVGIIEGIAAQRPN